MLMLQRRDILLGLRRSRRVPLILQQQRAECGIACVAMLASYYGKVVSLDAVRRKRPVSSRGSTLRDLMQSCSDLQMVGRPLRLGMSDIRRLRAPAILHWNMDHFVVLVKTRQKSMLINDPARGLRAVSHEEFSRAFTGVALEVSPEPGFSNSTKKQHVSLVDIVRTYRRLAPFLAVMFALVLVTQVLALAPPIATQLLIDELTLGQDGNWLRNALAGLGIVLLLSVLIDSLRRWVGLYAGTMLAVDTSAGAIAHLLKLPSSFHRERHIGDLMSRIDSLAPIRQAITDDAIQGMVQVLVVLSTLSLMYFYSARLTFISVLGTLLTLTVLAATLPAYRRFGEQALVHTARQNSSMMQTLRSTAAIRSLGIAPARLADWQNNFFDATNARVQQSRISILQGAAGGIFAALEQVLFLGIGINGIVEKELTLGALFATMSLRGRFAGAATMLASIAQRLFVLRTHTQRVSDILLAQPKSTNGYIDQKIVGRLSARSLSFGYPGGPDIFENFACDIAAGSLVAISGRSGCGKTTLLQLLSGQEDPASGYVAIDGIRIPLWCEAALTAGLGIVNQDDRLFQGSIAANISAFDPVPDHSRMRDAARMAEVAEDIEQMPMLYNTLIDDAGSALSGGQRQRLILARAVYRAPAVLFLDEATSHLDVATEERVLDNLQSLGITIVSVAHRPDVIDRAGHIIRLS